MAWLLTPSAGIQDKWSAYNPPKGKKSIHKVHFAPKDDIFTTRYVLYYLAFGHAGSLHEDFSKEEEPIHLIKEIKKHASRLGLLNHRPLYENESILPNSKRSSEKSDRLCIAYTSSPTHSSCPIPL